MHVIVCNQGSARSWFVYIYWLCYSIIFMFSHLKYFATSRLVDDAWSRPFFSYSWLVNSAPYSAEQHFGLGGSLESVGWGCLSFTEAKNAEAVNWQCVCVRERERDVENSCEREGGRGCACESMHEIKWGRETERESESERDTFTPIAPGEFLQNTSKQTRTRTTVRIISWKPSPQLVDTVRLWSVYVFVPCPEVIQDASGGWTERGTAGSFEAGMPALLLATDERVRTALSLFFFISLFLSTPLCPFFSLCLSLIWMLTEHHGIQQTDKGKDSSHDPKEDTERGFYQ